MFFDVDDLVIDQKYTDQIKYVKNMAPADKVLYDDGVNRMRETLKMCDYAITTTEHLATELKDYTKEVFINRNVASDEMIRYATEASKKVERDSSKKVIGYFSGSITHNEDFELALPSIVKLLKKYDNLYLKIVGILDIPKELQPFQDRLINIDFMDWREMPKEVATCDITIAPLTQTIFNEAKSENKWVEAALVKVVTVASDIGAFRQIVTHNETGILVDNNGWFEALDSLLVDEEKCKKLANAAYKDVLQRHTTVKTPYRVERFIQSKLARNIGLVLPSTDISGGVTVVVKHADILRHYGWDVTLIDAIDKTALRRSQKQYEYRLTIPGYNVVTAHKLESGAYFDTMVASLWSTLKYVKEYPNVKNRLYFVQSFETDFYSPGTGEPRFLANATYCDNTNVRYITMSRWCQNWLREQFDKSAEYAPNGIHTKYYPYRERSFKGKIKILIEGDSRDEYKNTDEAFRIVEKLDPAKYEISYLSYRKDPKRWYRVDHYYNRIAPEKVGEVYASCDILIKTSLLESFSLPPLEMMATGGVAVVVPNDGNREYLRDGENCLFYMQGDIDDGASKVERVVRDKALRDMLIKNGLQTGKDYDWKSREEDIAKLYQ